MVGSIAQHSQGGEYREAARAAQSQTNDLHWNLPLTYNKIDGSWWGYRKVQVFMDGPIHKCTTLSLCRANKLSHDLHKGNDMYVYLQVHEMSWGRRALYVCAAYKLSKM